jgi:CrcB protein
MRFVAVAVGGMIGSLSRWWIEELLLGPPLGFPWATFVVNVSGAFALGVIGSMLLERAFRWPHWRAFLGIGVIGSFTTFSTMALDGVRLADAGMASTALLYWMATLLLGQIMALAGMRLGRTNPVRRRHEADR